MGEVEKASVRTQFRLGELVVPAAMFKVIGDPPGKREYETAGPNGHPLRAVAAVGAAPEGETPKADPLGVSPTSAPRSTPGEYRQVLVEETTGVEVPRDQVRRGIRRDGTFVDLTEHLERIEEEAKLEAIEILTFIDRRNVPRERIVGSYFTALGGTLGLALARALLEAMRESGRVAVIRWTKRKGQTLGVLIPHASGALEALELAWAVQVRTPNAECLAHLRAEVTQGEVDQAVELIHEMSGKRADLDDLRDLRWQRIEELFVRAEEGELDDYKLEPEERPEEMADLEKLLADALPR